MQRALRPWITAGVALTGASIIAVTPVAARLPDVQYRPVQLSAVDNGINPFPEVSWNDFLTNTTANWNGLTEMFDHTTAIYSLPEAVYTQGLPQTFNDLLTLLQQLSTYSEAVAVQAGEVDPTGTLPPFPNIFANPALNPVSALSLLVQNALGSQYATNAAQAGLTGIYQNILPSSHDISTQFTDIGTLLKDVFTGVSVPTSAFETDFTNIGTDLTNIGNDLWLAPSTVLNDYLNGYPVQSAATDPLHSVIPTISDAYTLNAPFTATTNTSISPEFGLLTNPFAAFTTDTGGDGLSSTFLGTSPLDTGTLAALLQSEQTLSDELLTVTSAIPGSGVTAPPDTGPLTILGPDTLNFTLDLSKIPVIGDVITFINNTVIPFLNTALTATISATNTVIDGVNTAVTGLSSTINTVVNPFIDAIDGILSAINMIPGVDIKRNYAMSPLISRTFPIFPLPFQLSTPSTP